MRFTATRLMSFHGFQGSSSQTKEAVRKKVTIQTLHNLRASKTPMAMLTAYDYPTALACSSSPLVDITLIGDSLAQTCLGYNSTTQLSLDELIHHARAVVRGTTHPLTVADMPFGTYPTVETALNNASRVIRETQVDSVKLEGGKEIAHIVARLTSMGIPVMGQVGLLPQRHTSFSGYRVQGRTADDAKNVVQNALALQAAGAFAIAIEAVPRELGKYLTEKLSVPTLGIGAGPWTSGQVLVLDDAVGAWAGHKPKFVRRFAETKAQRDGGVHRFAEAVRSGQFPELETETYPMDKEEWKQFLKMEEESQSTDSD